ncbi:MAG: hypothetical protein II859_07555 [Bacteroidales bacterium]|nr:hypothetical protein [Bacteroidales bacterium]
MDLNSRELFGIKGNRFFVGRKRKKSNYSPLVDKAHSIKNERSRVVRTDFKVPFSFQGVTYSTIVSSQKVAHTFEQSLQKIISNGQ